MLDEVKPWSQFVAEDPNLALFASERLDRAVAYLATLRADGSPRLHPVSPIVRAGGLFLFMESTSPKRGDLLRDPRFALHAGVEDNDGGGGEIAIWGHARPIDDGTTRSAVATGDTPERRVLFELTVGRLVATTYHSTRVARRRWPA